MSHVAGHPVSGSSVIQKWNILPVVRVASSVEVALSDGMCGGTGLTRSAVFPKSENLAVASSVVAEALNRGGAERCAGGLLDVGTRNAQPGTSSIGPSVVARNTYAHSSLAANERSAREFGWVASALCSYSRAR